MVTKNKRKRPISIHFFIYFTFETKMCYYRGFVVPDYFFPRVWTVCFSRRSTRTKVRGHTSSQDSRRPSAATTGGSTTSAERLVNVGWGGRKLSREGMISMLGKGMGGRSGDPWGEGYVNLSISGVLNCGRLYLMVIKDVSFLSEAEWLDDSWVKAS